MPPDVLFQFEFALVGEGSEAELFAEKLDVVGIVRKAALQRSFCNRDTGAEAIHGLFIRGKQVMIEVLNRDEEDRVCRLTND